MSMAGKEVPSAATALRLARIFPGGDLRLCEAVRFAAGSAGIDTVLRRAAIAGCVEVGGDSADHFADMLNDNGDIVETVSLDASSFGALKNHWMRCRYERLLP